MMRHRYAEARAQLHSHAYFMSVLMSSADVQVFRLDAVQSSNSAAARRQLQNYLASLSSFRGRALLGPIAMPPTSRALPPPQSQVCACVLIRPWTTTPC